MTSAYDKIYLEKAQIVLGRMTDYAVYDLDLKMGIIRCWLECQE